MKKMFCAIVVFLAATAWTLGQESTNKSQTGGAAKKGTGTVLTGCLSGPNNEGAYELKQKGSKKEIEVGGAEDLSKHVGHQVKLHGSWVKSGSDIGEKESAEKKEGAEKTEKKEAAERHFKVTSIDHVADTCPSTSPAGKSGEHKSPSKPPSPGGEN